MKRIGLLSIGLGSVWIVAHGWTALGMFAGIGRRVGFYSFAYSASSAVFFALSILLLLGGVISAGARPTEMGRKLLLAYAIGTLTAGILARTVAQLSFGLDRAFMPGQLLSFVSSLALIASLPVALLFLLQMPAVRRVYR